MKNIASVVLNYNSFDDLSVLVPQLIRQKNINHTIVIVDNNSTAKCRDQIKNWLNENYPSSTIGIIDSAAKATDVYNEQVFNASIICIFNNDNRGYSAGNNIGIKLAEKLKADAVLIANPDVRIDNFEYLERLSDALFASDKYYVAGSKVLDNSGADQNPQKESNFFEEFFWPYQKLKFKITGRRSLANCFVETASEVQKLSGCCLMIRVDFLARSGYLDENVFLYCEEAVLASQVKNFGGVMFYEPNLLAIHAHRNSDKVSQCKSSLTFINSRKYYIKEYGKYRWPAKILILWSYAFMSLYFRLKAHLIKHSK